MIDDDARCAHRELEERLRPFVARSVPRTDVDDVLQDVFLRELLDECCRIGVDARGRVIDCEPRAASDCPCKNA